MKTSQPGTERNKVSRLSQASIVYNVKTKLVFTCVFVALALLALCIRLVMLVADKGEEYSRIVYANQLNDNTELPFRRGAITDRYGTVLAQSMQRYRVIIEPQNIIANNEANRQTTVDALVTQLGCDETKVNEAIEKYRRYYYARIDKEITPEEKAQFELYVKSFNNEQEARKKEEKNLPANLRSSYPVITGVTFESFYKRSYPYESFASDVLGYSIYDASDGNYGLEQFYNRFLTGENGRKLTYISSDGITERIVTEPVNGASVVSTIDYTIQSAAEECIEDFFRAYTADNVGIIVADPNNGEILAMAMDRPLNLNDPGNAVDVIGSDVYKQMTAEEQNLAVAKIRSNFAVESAYEPGSTAKPLTVAAALEEDTEEEDAVFNCDGGEGFGVGGSDTYVNCSGGPHDEVSLTDALAVSCNDALMQIGRKLGAEKLVNYISLFGFGRQSGIDLPYENAGQVHSLEEMDPVTVATNSFGQNYSVNMVQLTMAFCSVINGGTYYQPHLMKEIVSDDGVVLKRFEPVVMHKTVTRQTSEFIRKALREAVTDGTGVHAAVEGYEIGGKTGTAEKLPREDKKYLVSFAGFTPVDDPKIVIYTVIDNPSRKDGGVLEVNATLAVNLEKNVMEKILPYLAIPKDTGE